MVEMSEVILEGAGAPVAEIRLNRPDKLNALTDSTVTAFFAALDQVAASGSAVLIVSGEGRGFCAGFDLGLANVVPDDTGDEHEAWSHRQERYASLVTRMRAIPQPIIAAVNGPAAGAGFGIALGADIRLASPEARFIAAFIRIGLTSCDIGVTWLLPRAVGTSRANEIMLTGRAVGGEEAERIGLVSALHPAEELMPAARRLAAGIAQNGRMQTWMTKRGAWANLEAGSLAAAIELENRTQMLVRGTGSLERRAAERGFLKNA